MLQQTQVDTVLPYFHRWMARFAGFQDLARASVEEILKHWEGLGYYSRARNLHRLAQIVVGFKKIPTDVDSWLALPGVGPYTAAAITSISFGEPAAVIDGNVIRILSRLTADGTAFKGNSEAVKRLQPIADALLDPKYPGDHNQAMMELGATVCLRNNPLCLRCPVQDLCAAYHQGNPQDYPKLLRRKTERVEVERLWIIHNEALLLQRAPKGSVRLAEIHELPRRDILKQTKDAVLLATKKRAISNQQIKERIYAVRVTAERSAQLAALQNLSWVPLDKINAVTLSGPHRRWIADLLASGSWQAS